jgi:ATP-dependent RNA helicase DHX57
LLNLRAYNAAVACGGYSAMRSFCEENFVNFNTVRDISSLRQDFQAALAEIGLIDPPGRGPRRNQDLDDWNVNSENESLLKGILVGAFWPRIVRIRLPDAKYEKVQAGSVAKEHEAREVKYYDSVDNSRVFIVSYSPVLVPPYCYSSVLYGSIRALSFSTRTTSSQGISPSSTERKHRKFSYLMRHL